jgi:hypothetical protein
MYNYFPPQYRKPIGVGVIIIIGLVVFYFVIKKNTKLSNILGLNTNTEPAYDKVEVSKDNLRSGFNPKNQVHILTNLLKKNWDSGEDEKAFDTILDYSDDELKAVHNAWIEVYKNEWLFTAVKNTLRNQVDAETVFYYRKDVLAKKKKVLARLDKLNL